jgi:hypothetical protein
MEKEIKIEPPEKFTFHNVMFWEPHSRQLLEKKKDGSTEAATMLTKAKKFLEFKCIERKGAAWICKPIKEYNKTTYNIAHEEYGWKCNCQGFANNNICSHIIAVKQFEFISRDGKE